MTERAWTDLELYVLNEHIEDFQDGIITRRELLRKVTFMTGSLALTLALLPTLGCNVDQPRSGASATATGIAAAAPSASSRSRRPRPPPMASPCGWTTRGSPSSPRT